MRTIEVLDRTTIDKIAAGEVVERPASVVKELVENAIDADSTAITVEIRDGGCSLIRITDNGCGIPSDQVKKAFFRHATSKIRKVEDLTLIASLGFRGEALSSISAVAQVELITKTPEALTGTRYCIDGGIEKDFEEVGAPSGSTFLIRNLFFNVPARAKFLKSAMTEGNHVTAVVEQLALSHPDISFKYIQNGQSKLYTSGNGNLQEIIYQVFGRDIAKELIPFNSESDTMTIKGFIGKPVIARGNRNFENYFVNGRYVKSKLIAKAIEDGYHGFMMQHRYPFTLLYFEINGEKVDVNVHPSKMELRFSDQEGLYHQVCLAIKNALMHRENIPSVSIGREERKAPKETPKPVSVSAPEPFESKRRSFQLSGAPTQPSRTVEQGAEKLADKDLSENKTLSAGKNDEAWIPEGNKKTTYKNPASFKTIFETNTQPYSSTGVSTANKFERNKTVVESNTAEDESKKNVVEPNSTSVESNISSVGSNLEAFKNKIPAVEQVSTTFENDKTAIASNTDAIETPKGSSERNTTDEAQSAILPGQQLQLFDDVLLSEKSKKRHTIIGQVFDTYYLVEFDNALYIIDQHAAHEKVLYERMIKNYENRSVLSQMISPPAVVSLSSAEVILLEKYMDVFASYGFELEHFGGKEYKICGVPSELYRTSPEQLFRDIMDQLEKYGDHKPEAVAERLASMACKAAVKGNNSLSSAEAEALIDELLTLENPYNCPHGRPTIISMTKYELEKKFKRIV